LFVDFYNKQHKNEENIRAKEMSLSHFSCSDFITSIGFVALQ
jgi:hypothetical protein